MRRATLAAICLAALLAGARSVGATETERLDRDASIASQRELVEEVRGFLRTAKASLEKWDGLPDRLAGAVYLAGVRDGALGATVALCVFAVAVLAVRTRERS